MVMFGIIGRSKLGFLLMLCTILLGLISKDSQGIRSFIDRNEVEMSLSDYNELETVEMTCMFVNDSMLYQEDQHCKPKSSQSKSDSHTTRNMNFRISRRNQWFRGQGWYGCADFGEDIQNGDNGKPDVGWISFIGDGFEDLMPAYRDDQPGSRGIEYSISIACYNPRTSNSLDTLPNECVLPSTQEWAFGNRTDIFNILRYAKAEDFEHYSCFVLHSYKEYRVKAYMVFSQRASIILKSESEYMKKGSDLHIKCVIQLKQYNETDFVFDWMTPNDVYFQKRNHKIEIYSSRKTVVSEFVKKNVTNHDQGEYICKITVHSDIDDKFYRFQTKVYIYVKDPMVEPYVTLNSSNNQYEVHPGNSIEFSANVSGDPKPTIAWYSPSGKEIRSGSEILIRNDVARTSLYIAHTTGRYMGDYSLRAFNRAVGNTLNFTLKVIADEVGVNIDIDYLPSKGAELYCNVRGYPLTNVTWSYANYSSSHLAVLTCKLIPLMEIHEITSLCCLPNLFFGIH